MARRQDSDTPRAEAERVELIRRQNAERQRRHRERQRVAKAARVYDAVEPSDADLFEELTT